MTAIFAFVLALAVIVIGGLICCLPIYFLQLYCVRRKTIIPMVALVGVLAALAALQMMNHP